MNIRTSSLDTDTQASLPALARTHLRDAGGDCDKASHSLFKALMADKATLKLVVEAAVYDAIDYRVRQSMRTERQAIVSGVNRGQVIALASGMAATILDMPLAGGKRLRDCLKADVEDQATRYEAMAGDMMIKARFLRRIEKNTTGAKTVGECVSEDKAQKLWEQANDKS